MLKRARDLLVARLSTVVEVGFVLLLVAGVALMHVPVAMILGGVLGVVACERASSRGAQRSMADVARLRVPEQRSERAA